MTVGIREKSLLVGLRVPSLVCQADIRDRLIFGRLSAPHYLGRITAKITTKFNRFTDREGVVGGILLKIFPEIMRDRRTVIHLLRPEHALENRVVNIIFEHSVAAREIKIRSPAEISKIVVGGDLTARKASAARRTPCRIFVSDASRKLEYRVLLRDRGQEPDITARHKRFQISLRVIHKTQSQIIVTAQIRFRHIRLVLFFGEFLSRRVPRQVINPAFKRPGRRDDTCHRCGDGALHRRNRRRGNILNKTRIKIRHVVGFHHLQEPEILIPTIIGIIRIDTMLLDCRTAVIVTIDIRGPAVRVIFAHTCEGCIRPKCNRLRDCRPLHLIDRHIPEL